MATLNVSLTLQSTDTSSDTLDLTITDELAVGLPSVGLSRVTAPSGGGTAVTIAPSLDARRYLYLKHTGVDSSGATVATEVYVETAGAVWFSKLAAGEFLLMPINANGAQLIQCRATSGDIVVEYAYWTKS